MGMEEMKLIDPHTMKYQLCGPEKEDGGNG